MAQRIWLIVAFLLATVLGAEGAQNLMQNPGFESHLTGHWEAAGFTVTISSDAHGGHNAGKFTNRKGFYQGPAQLLSGLQPGKLYYYTSYVKQLNDMPGKLFQRYRVNIGFNMKDTGMSHTWAQLHEEKLGATQQVVALGPTHPSIKQAIRQGASGMSVQGHPDYHTAMAAIDALRANGLDQWDVMNELLHSQWFENKVDDPLYSETLYKEVHRLDSTPKLLLNDYAVVAGPEMADAYVQQAERWLSHGVPLHGLGIQSHFHHMTPDPKLMRLQLDLLGTSGLPVWVTEMDVRQRDENLRAQYLETALRVYFSHAAEEGIVLWGFWSQAVVSPLQGALFDAHLQPNAAGTVYIRLTQNELSTHNNTNLSHGNTFDLRGFKGDYEATVKVRGHAVKVVPFKVNGYSIVNIQVPAS